MESKSKNSRKAPDQLVATDASLHLTTSDGGHRITMQGSRRANKHASKVQIFLLCLAYGLSSTGFTFVNKKIYVIFGEVSPLNLLMVQCLFNVVTCLTLMTIKEVNASSFASLSKYGIVVPELNKITDKCDIGLRVGLANLVTVILGLFASKFSPLPL